MRKILIAIAAVLVMAQVTWGNAITWFSPEEAGPTYLVNQNFEGTGYDNSETWTETGSPNPDYTTTILRGSQSWNAPTGGASSSYLSFTAQSTVWAHFMFRVPDATPSNTDIIFRLRNGTTTVLQLSLLTSGVLRLYQGSSQSDGPTLSDNTTYHVWVKYIISSGSNDGIAELYVSEDTTRGSVDASISNGTATSSAGNVYLYGYYSNPIFDYILVDDEEISNVVR